MLPPESTRPLVDDEPGLLATLVPMDRRRIVEPVHGEPFDDLVRLFDDEGTCGGCNAAAERIRRCMRSTTTGRRLHPRRRGRCNPRFAHPDLVLGEEHNAWPRVYRLHGHKE